MRKRTGQWRQVKTLTAGEKAAIAAPCERLIAEIFKPRYLPEIRPASFNYPVDIFGRWQGNRYSFITRYRSGFPENAGEEFNSAFTRLDHIGDSDGENRFNVMWYRHTGRWWLLHASLTIEQALHVIKTNGLLHPLT